MKIVISIEKLSAGDKKVEKKSLPFQVEEERGWISKSNSFNFNVDFPESFTTSFLRT